MCSWYDCSKWCNVDSERKSGELFLNESKKVVKERKGKWSLAAMIDNIMNVAMIGNAKYGTTSSE